MATNNAQIPTIYAQAISRYHEITKSDLDINFFCRLHSVDDLTKEVDARNQTFAEFRSKRHIFFECLSTAMKPVELVGNLAAGAASTAFPPSSMVFGAVSYLINAAKGQSASYDAIQDLMVTLKDFTIRLKVYTREQISTELSNKLSDILVTLIEIFALSTKAIKGGRLLKFGRNILLGTDDKIQSCVTKLDNITKTETSLVVAETLTESKRTGRVVDDVEATVRKTDNTVNETAQGVGQISFEVTAVRETLGSVLLKINELSEFKKEEDADADNTHLGHSLIKNLRPSKPNTAQDWYDKISKVRVPKTGDWVRAEDVFMRWVGRDVPIIFVSGNPGAGKSFLSSNIIAFLREQHPQGVQHPSHISVGYFFFKDDNPSTRSFHQALRDLAYQISLNDPIYHKYLSGALEDYESISTLESAWRTLFVGYFLTNKNIDSSVYMLFDGVDEAFENERDMFLSLIKDVHDAGDKARIQLAIVGRPQLGDQILDALGTDAVPTIYVTSLKNSEDIEHYIKSSIQRSAILKRVSAKLREEIVEKLSSGAQGMFIWVDLMLKELLKKRNESSMRKSLDQAPRGLNEILRHVLESFSASSNEEELEYLNELLAWTACAPRPFSLGEIETILKLKSPSGDGMIYTEGALRKQFASFFVLDREDGLTTAELYNRQYYKADSDDEDDEAEREEAFEDVENETDFESNRETTEVAFCHSSIGDFFRDEGQGKVSAGEGHIPVGVDFRDAKVNTLKACLKLICDTEFAQKAEDIAAFGKSYAAVYWLWHLQSVQVPDAEFEDRKEIASLLVQIFSDQATLESWTRITAWNSNNETLKLVRQWWKDKEVVDSLPQEEREFVTSTAEAPATTFKPAAMQYARAWFDKPELNPPYCAAAIISYMQFEDETNADSTSLNWQPPAADTLAAAEWCNMEQTAKWHRRLAMAFRYFGNYDEALEHFLKSIEMDPSEWITSAGLAILYALKKEWSKVVDLDEQTEQILLKKIQEEPSKVEENKSSLHTVQERLGDVYAALNEEKKRFAIYKRAIASKPGCDHCINTILFYNNGQGLYHDTIEMLKDLNSQQTPGKNYTLLTASLWRNSQPTDPYFERCADAAVQTDELEFLVEAYQTAIQAAKKEIRIVTTSWLSLSLARLYKEYVGDEKKAVRTWERIMDTFAASKDESEIGYIKILTSVFLARHSIIQAIDAGIGSAESEKQGKRLEKIVKKKTSKANEETFISAGMTALILGMWYRLNGRLEEANACFRPSIKHALYILSDDDPENDGEGLIELFRALFMAGDDANALAILYYIGRYKNIEEKMDDEKDDNISGSSDEEAVFTCDGPCRRGFLIPDTISLCRHCFEIGFCKDCVQLLGGNMPINVCSEKHKKDFLYVPPRSQNVEQGKLLVDGKVFGFEEWMESLKKLWKV